MAGERRDSLLSVIVRILLGTVVVGIVINLVSNGIRLPAWISGVVLVPVVAGWIAYEWRSPGSRAKSVSARLSALPQSPPQRFVDPGGLLPRVLDLLTSADNKSPTVGLWGMSGIGKTTLALQAAYGQRKFPGLVLWADLRAENEAVPVLRTWLAWLGETMAEEQGGLPDLLAVLHRVLSRRIARHGRVLT